MILAYRDKMGGPVMLVPKRYNNRGQLPFCSETPIEYASRFMKEMRGVGNINFYRIRGRNIRKIGERGM